MIRMANQNLNAAKNAKKDEFYTQLVDIENELKHYKIHFKGKTVLCNCDDPRVSNFFHYFSYNFEQLGLKKLITTCYKNQNRDLFSQNDSERAIWLEYFGDKNNNRVPDPEEIGIHYFEGDGDFRSQECIELLKEADIVVTNPPFSLFREYVAQLMKYEKKFVIIGNQNALHYKEIFPLIKNNLVWIGYSSPKLFRIPDDFESKTIKIQDGVRYQQFGNILWFTNLDIKKRHEELILFKMYNSEEYPRYGNYDAIDVNAVSEIPNDYYGIMGVPDSFLGQFNPDQFEIIGIGSGEIAKKIGVRKNYRGRTDVALCINGVNKCPYSRILIRRRQRTGDVVETCHGAKNVVETCHGASLRTEPPHPYPQSDPALPMAAEPETKYRGTSKSGDKNGNNHPPM
ncbi:MAG: adenine-specific methyltransferase EcoRI family protein [Bacteroidales bacterium]|nr:adenine-specific methyltransferase EcoRI family protein [Bacteroidales bacterium]